MKSNKDSFTIDEIIGRNLQNYRKLMGLERKEVAEAFHITDDALYRIEKGQIGLTSVYAYVLANTFHCDMNYIFGGTDIPDIVATDEKDISRVLRYCAELIEMRSKK